MSQFQAVVHVQSLPRSSGDPDFAPTDPGDPEVQELALSVRVLIADDFELMREGIQAALESHPKIEVVGHAADGAEAVERAQELRPDVVMLDLRMSRNGGMEVIDVCREQLPEIKIMVLTANENPDNLRAAIAAGAAGYLTKQTPGDELCDAVLNVHRGGLVVGASLASQLVSERAPEPDAGELVPPALTARQRAIVRLVSMGLTDKEIGEKLFLSIRTVQYDLTKVKNETGLSRRAEIARWAVINSLG